MNNEFKFMEDLEKMNRKIRRTRVAGLLGFGLVGGILYHLKVTHHDTFSDIYAKHKLKSEEKRENGGQCPVQLPEPFRHFDWKKFDIRTNSSKLFTNKESKE